MRTLEKRMRVAAVALVMYGIAATWVGGQVARAQSTSSSPPPTLNGETFATANPNSGGNPNSTHCNSDGSGTFTYSASGTATGPYNGTFTETGTVTTDSSRNIIASSAHFTITSAQGTVTGSETIASNSPLGTCGGIQPTGDSFIKSQDNYQATITTPSGNYLDQGNFSKGLARK